MSDTTTEARRLAIESIATLVNVKRSAADQLLRRAGAPEDLIVKFLKDRDQATGERLSKRVAATAMLDDLAMRGLEERFVGALIDIACDWDAFHLSADEYRARAIVQKAREIRGELAEHAEREAARNRARAQEARARQDAERASQLSQQSGLLLAQFDHLAASDDPHGRGFLLQDLLGRLFALHEFPVARSFQRNEGGEQIDGAFEMAGWHYLVECRWRKAPADMRDLDGLLGQVTRSARQTMGMFLSINGWSHNVVSLLKQSPDKAIVLMDGYDLRMALMREVELRSLIEAKVRALNLSAEPFFSARQLLADVDQKSVGR
ncbi:restriction endonuclease [Sphingobium fuliginis]|jgi:hypothetical protein|uniref:Restriction endonuclease n=1 Tax=Sphingobium fuliginis (strain ATCC 27551) TaxID=336203 RepID=A0A7M2GPK6_SPHSA|nr:restriction endonuclease [Sphingobium fuliginis]QOT74147.1 restriction endonuclease [Sphingobium fuliginis]